MMIVCPHRVLLPEGHCPDAAKLPTRTMTETLRSSVIGIAEPRLVKAST